MRLRVRSPLGVANLTVISTKSEEDDPTLNDLCSEIVRSNNSIHNNNKHRIAEIRFGFGETQRTVSCDVSNANTNGKESLKTLGISDGETITVKFTEEEEEEKEEEVKEQKQVGEATGFRNNGNGFEEEPTPTPTNNDDDNNDKSGMMTEEEEFLARAVEASMLDDGRMRAAKSTTSALDIDDDGTVAVRKVIDADNSCLFNAIGYVFFRSLAKAKELRKVVHDAVLSDPDTFSEAALETAERVRRVGVTTQLLGRPSRTVRLVHALTKTNRGVRRPNRPSRHLRRRPFPTLRTRPSHLRRLTLRRVSLRLPGFGRRLGHARDRRRLLSRTNLKNKRIRPKSSRVGKKRPGAKTVHRCRQFFAQVFSLSNRPRRRKRSQRTRQEHRAYELWRVLRKIRRIPLAEKEFEQQHKHKQLERKKERTRELPGETVKNALLVLHRV